jgi:hypothetical protein
MSQDHVTLAALRDCCACKADLVLGWIRNDRPPVDLRKNGLCRHEPSADVISRDGFGADGFETGEHTYLVRPRSFLIVGSLAQLRSERGVHVAKLRSFELYRRNLYEPEVVTFDELLARAEWHVANDAAHAEAIVLD